jgi:hypothetical protein
MSIQGKLARVIEANRISGVKAYGDVEYREVDPRMEMWKLEAIWLTEQRKKQKEEENK